MTIVHLWRKPLQAEIWFHFLRVQILLLFPISLCPEHYFQAPSVSSQRLAEPLSRWSQHHPLSDPQIMNRRLRKWEVYTHQEGREASSTGYTARSQRHNVILQKASSDQWQDSLVPDETLLDFKTQIVTLKWDKIYHKFNLTYLMIYIMIIMAPEDQI